MGITQIKSLVQFTRGTSLVWAALTTPIPAGVVTFSIDDGVFKLGDGATAYSNLPTLFTFSQLVAAQGGASVLFDQPVAATSGNLIVISLEAATNTIMYSISNTSLTSLLTSISAIEAETAAQDTTIAALMSSALTIDASITSGTSGDIVVIKNGRYSDSGVTVAQLTAQVAAGIVFNPGSHVMDPIFYTSSSLSVVANKMSLTDNNTYYVDVVGCNNNVATPVFGLTCANPNVTVEHVSGSIFSVKLSGVCGNGVNEATLVLVCSVDDGTGKATVKKAVVAIVVADSIIEVIFGGTGSSVIGNAFGRMVIDSNNDIICVGSSKYSSASWGGALVAKFDNHFNLIAQTILGDTGGSMFTDVAIDASGNIIAVGYDEFNGFIVKFDSNLNIINKEMTSGGTIYITFNGISIDTLGNIFVVGAAVNSVTPYNAEGIVIKFDTNLNVITQKFYGITLPNPSYDIAEFYSVTIDTNNNVIVVGRVKTLFGGSGNATDSTIVFKLDNSLNVIVSNVYSGTISEWWNDVVTDSANNIICVGYTQSALGFFGCPNYRAAMIAKFDPSLNLLEAKVYGGTFNDVFNGVTIDKNGNIFAVGYTFSEGTGSPTNCDTMMVEFDASLNIISQKGYGFPTSNDYFWGVTVDKNDHVICGGNTYDGSTTNTTQSMVMLKLIDNIPSGSFTGTIITGLTLYDSNLNIAAAGLTSQTSSTLVLSPSTVVSMSSTGSLTPVTSTFTAVDDTLHSSGVTGISISSVGVYSDSGCTVPAALLYNNTTYYAQILAAGGGGSQSTDTYTLVSNNAGVVTTAVGNGVFSLAVGTVASAGTLTFTASASYNGVTANSSTTASLNGTPTMTVTGIAFFSDSACTQAVTSFNSNTTYYAKISANDPSGTASQYTYALTSTNSSVTIVNLTNGVFSIAVGTIITATTLTVIGTATYSSQSGQNTANIPLNAAASMSVSSIEFFSDPLCTQAVTSFNSNTTYYAKIVASYGSVAASGYSYTLTGNNSNVTINPSGGGVFSLAVGSITAAATLTVTGTAVYNGSSAQNTANITLNVISVMVINSVGIFSDSACTIPASALNNNTTYYSKIVATYGNVAASAMTFLLTSNNSGVTVSSQGSGIFTVSVGAIASLSTLTLTATATYNGISASSPCSAILNSWPAIVISSFGVYTNSACTIAATSFNNNTTYYAKVVATGGSPSNTFSLTSNDSYVTVSNLGNGVFSLSVGAVPSPGSVTLSPTVTCSDGNRTTSTTVTLNSWPALSISGVGVYNDAGCTSPAGSFNNNTQYYAQIYASGGAGAGNTYSMSSNNGNVSVSQVSQTVFGIWVGTVDYGTTLTLSSTVSCSDGSTSNNVNVWLNGAPPFSITGIGIYLDAACTIPDTLYTMPPNWMNGYTNTGETPAILYPGGGEYVNGSGAWSDYYYVKIFTSGGVGGNSYSLNIEAPVGIGAAVGMGFGESITATNQGNGVFLLNIPVYDNTSGDFSIKFDGYASSGPFNAGPASCIGYLPQNDFSSNDPGPT